MKQLKRLAAPAVAGAALVVLAALAAAAVPGGAWAPSRHAPEPRASWLDQVNVFHWKGSATAPFSGAIWGFSPYPDSELENLKFDVNWWHERGDIYLGSMEFGNDWMGADVPASQAALDLHLQPLQGWSGGMPALHNADWQDRLLGWLRTAIDAGVDGMLIDGYQQNATLVIDSGGSFDGDTMRDFREHLKGKYTSAQLRALGINDVDSFDYREWILAHGVEKTWNDTPLQGLAAEFYLYELQYAKDFLERFRHEGQQYARDTYGRDFYLSDNNAGGTFLSADVNDLLVGEFFYYHWWPHSTDYAASDIEIRRAMGRGPVVVVPEIGVRSDAHPPDQTRNLIRFVLADIYSAGGTALFHEDKLLRINTRKGQYLTQIGTETAVVAAYNGFILGHPELYQGLESTARVGVVYSSASNVNQDVALEHGKNQNQAMAVGYSGVSKMLLRENIQHDAVYLTDPRFSKDRLKGKTLSRYRVIVVPNAYSLSNRQARKLLAYVRKGGVLLLTDGAGKWDEWGNRANRAAWEALLQEGTHQVRKGTAIYTPDAVGAWYEGDDGDQWKDFVVTALDSHITRQTIVQGADKVRVHLYRKSGQQEWVLHLFNTDYDPNTDAFTSTGAFTLSVLAGAGKYQATLLSPDLAGEQQLKARTKQGRVRIKVPSFEAYVVIRLRPR